MGVEQPPSTEFYFYQSEDGQCVFLHPLVSRALLAYYGSYAACPPQVRSCLLTKNPSILMFVMYSTADFGKPEVSQQKPDESQHVLYHIHRSSIYSVR